MPTYPVPEPRRYTLNTLRGAKMLPEIEFSG